MLVLTRKLREKIVIDGDIVITVVRIERDKVRIGVNAPPNIKVLRSELLAPDDPRHTRYPESRRD